MLALGVVCRQVFSRDFCLLQRLLARPPALPHVLSSGLSGKSLPPHVLVRLPALSPTMTHGTIESWDVQVGAKVDEGDQIASMETDKATMALESPESGFMAKILLPAGTKDIPISDVICVIAEEEDDIDAFADFSVTDDLQNGPPHSRPHLPDSSPHSRPHPPNSPPHPSEGRPGPSTVRASPMARRLAKERGIDLKSLSAKNIHSPDGVIRKDDVLSHKQTSVSPTPSPSADFTDIPLTNMRQVISSRLLEAKQSIPHYYLTVEVAMDDCMRLRKTLNAAVSINDIVIKASALSCLAHPEVNSSFRDGFIRQFHHVDVSVAVNTPDGLFTPIVFGAQSLGLGSIGERVRGLAERARERKLRPEEFQGGTFTVSNLGMFGVGQFCAIINPPQSSILAVGAIRKAVVCEESDYRVGSVMSVTLSCDHRVVDGAVAAQWLAHFKKLMETPQLMLL